MAKNRYYAVRNGRKPGIYTSWPEAEQEVKSFSNAEFKGFPTLEEAEAYMLPKDAQMIDMTSKELEIYVDGSFDSESQIYGSGIVILKDDQVIEELAIPSQDDSFVESYQVAGEVLSVIHALTWMKEQGYTSAAIYYDYIGIEEWVTGGWKAEKPISKYYVKRYQELVDGLDIDFIKVKAHSGVTYNDRADNLANQAIASRRSL
ncbi:MULTISPECIES: viroplasmin family protein [unclassified Streptococcus]|uniref:ribonuclease H1 domain-containing protein n=1 Tax=unclassified Streptococcus TaxID=2608887 RepID=UPI0011B5AD6B|nr:MULTISPECIES: ribonuclease H family protein [unclassified Streptococcus]TWT11279.1 ribonuclease [Streptococcus sp. sy004]TWT16264.1 ribonuclease [Streptococcus sp. sy010]